MGKKKRKKRKRQASSGKEGAGGKSPFPRLGWTRSPVQKPHSTKKGRKGYDRKRLKREDKAEAETDL